MNTELELRQKIILMVAVAVLLRLLAMPFFMHMDLLSEFRRINYAMENLAFYPGFNRLTIFYIESLFYSITQWFVVNPELLLDLPDPKHSTASVTTHFIFTGDPHVFRHLFLFKIPYLVFDLLTAWLIWQYFAGHKLRVLALAIWLFNPVTIYASYIFGRFDVISLFFVVWTVLCLKNKNFIWAALAFGLTLQTREINLIYLPAFILVIAYSFKNDLISRAQVAGTLAITLFFLTLPTIIETVFNIESTFVRESSMFEVYKGISTFFDGQINGIYPFFFVSAICYFALLAHNHLEPEKLFIVAALSVIIPFFMTGFNSAHYFSWIIPLLILAVCHYKHLVVPILGLLAGWFGFWLFYPQGAHFTPLLATPVHEAFFGLGSFKRFYTTSIPHPSILTADVMRDIFLSICLAAFVVILYRIHHTKNVR